MTTEFCFATGILALAKLTLGNNGGPQGTEEKGQVLTGYNVSSLVIDTLCDQAGGQNATIACFYFDFATQKEQSPTNMLGATAGHADIECRKKILSEEEPMH